MKFSDCGGKIIPDFVLFAIGWFDFKSNYFRTLFVIIFFFFFFSGESSTHTTWFISHVPRHVSK